MNSPNPELHDLKKAYAKLAEERAKADEKLAVHLENGDLDAYTKTHEKLRQIAEEFKSKAESVYSTLPDGRRIFTPDLAAIEEFAADNGVAFYKIKIALDDTGRVSELTANFLQLSKLDALAGLTALNELDLSYNQIYDITPLAGLTALTTLSLSVNQLSDLRPIAALTALTSLDLYNNQISDLSVIKILKGRGCRVDY